jgi:ATP-binding cassette subfamily C exporter for protease/lipase
MSAAPSLTSAGTVNTTLDMPASVHMGTPAPQRELLRTLGMFRREFLIVGLLSAAVNLLMLTPTIYMLQVYDRVMVSLNTLTLIAVSLITLALFGLMAFAEWARSRLLVHTGVRIDEQLSTRVFNASFESHLAGMCEPGRSPGRAFSDLLQVRQFITGNGVFAFFDLPWVPIYIAVMFLLHPLLGWVSIAFALLQSALTWFGHRRSLEPTEAAQAAQTDETLYVQGKLRNAEVLESMGMAANLQKLWWRRHKHTLQAHGQSQSISHRVTALSKFVRYVQQAASLAVGALLVIRGELSPGAMIAANILMTRALAPIDLMVATWKGFITAREAFKRLTRLLESHPERDPALQRARPEGAVALKQVVATAPTRREPILKGINLQLDPGTVLVVLGPSGSGKSTLARVILGIWGDVAGQVLLDGRPIESWDRVELGPHVGYLPQDIELFEGSIAENIARFGQVDSAQVIAAAQAAGLHDMILRFPKGYDTPMGVAGSLLSGGQRQRVALARALYGEPRLVVLDEPNANLDDVGEAALARAVIALKQKGNTVVLVTHRPGAIAVADRLMVLRDGVVQIQGPRDEVIAALRPAAASALGAAPQPPGASSSA